MENIVSIFLSITEEAERREQEALDPRVRPLRRGPGRQHIQKLHRLWQWLSQGDINTIDEKNKLLGEDDTVQDQVSLAPEGSRRCVRGQHFGCRYPRGGRDVRTTVLRLLRDYRAGTSALGRSQCSEAQLGPMPRNPRIV